MCGRRGVLVESASNVRQERGMDGSASNVPQERGTERVCHQCTLLTGEGHRLSLPAMHIAGKRGVLALVMARPPPMT